MIKSSLQLDQKEVNNLDMPFLYSEIRLINVKFLQFLAQKSWTLNIMAKLIFITFNYISSNNVFTFIFSLHFMYEKKCSFLCTFLMYCKKSCNGSEKWFIYPSILSLTRIRNDCSDKKKKSRTLLSCVLLSSSQFVFRIFLTQVIPRQNENQRLAFSCGLHIRVHLLTWRDFVLLFSFPNCFC